MNNEKIGRLKKVFSFFILIVVLSFAFYYSNSNKREVGISKEQFKKMDLKGQSDFVEKMAEDNPAKAWEFTKQNFIINGQVVGNAHTFAHTIGHAAFKKSGIEGIKICDPSFAFGCFHGVTESMLLSGGVSQVKKIENECLRLFPPDKSQNYTGCIHGTGHGLFEWETGDLKKALSDCDIISDPYRQYCYDGVFMENSNRSENRIIDANNPWKFCHDLDVRYHRNCARYQSQIFLGQFGKPNSVTLVGKYCALATTVLLTETCFESLGYYISQNALGKSSDIWQNCKVMPSLDGVEICLKGAATEAVFQKYAGFESSANELCKKLREPRQSQCLNNIKNVQN